MRHVAESPMKKIVGEVHSIVNTALWAFCAATVIWLVFSLPKMMDARATAERLLARELMEESRTYCEKWGLAVGTHEHALCTLDVQELRERHQKRVLAGIDIF